ncbi:hypothetical protein DQ04_04931050 [Trypanosoma grayi]|uniref:hypothetical protein n=1 Tax=Trypanosoma grayi TaxID=71804 RepID=UPI0004F48651|nr:hypothetical protein DQ04_04931050 [Trypanosoma grayi]KEG09624.1 hypothetical protein DQ04_04931050 [Trypanosoma grayi]
MTSSPFPCMAPCDPPFATSATGTGGASPDVRPQNKRQRVEQTPCDTWRKDICRFLDAAAASARPELTVAEFSRERIVFEAYRVLRSCWLFRGNARDAFEPACHLHKVTQQVLVTYCGYGLTYDGQYLVLKGEEWMPSVGLLLVVLQQMLREYGDHGQSALATMVTKPAAGLRSHASACGFGNAEVCVVTLSCEGFGQLDAAGGFEHRQERLMAVRQVLREAVDAAAHPSVVLLGDCVLSESDVLALAEGLHAECFTAEQHHGYGIACLVSGANARAACGVVGDDDNDDASLAHAVSCGSWRTRSMCVHGVLLSPMGPLFLHAQQYSNCDGANGADPDEAGLHEWLGRVAQAPQPTVVVQWGIESLPLLGDYRRCATTGAGDGDGPVMHGRGAAVVESPAASGECRVWRVRVPLDL